MIIRFSISAISLLTGFVACILIFSFLAFLLPLADSIAHFRLYLTGVMALAAVVLFLLRDRRSAGIACAVSVFGVIGLAPAFPAWDSARVAKDTPTVTLVQFNLSYRNRRLEEVADFIRGEGADVVTLQEVTARTGRVIELLEKEYPHRVVCRFSGVGDVAVLSRLPAAPGPSRGCHEKNGLAWLRIMAGGRPVSVASVHLHWPYPFKQALQLDRLQPHLEAIPRPVLVAGDFNAAPWSHAVGRVAEATDTRVAGGLRLTFDFQPVRWAPAVRMPIDHILLPDGFAPLAVRSTSGPGPGSDHAAIVARLALPGARPAEGLSGNSSLLR